MQLNPCCKDTCAISELIQPPHGSDHAFVAVQLDADLLLFRLLFVCGLLVGLLLRCPLLLFLAKGCRLLFRCRLQQVTITRSKAKTRPSLRVVRTLTNGLSIMTQDSIRVMVWQWSAGLCSSMLVNCSAPYEQRIKRMIDVYHCPIRSTPEGHLADRDGTGPQRPTAHLFGLCHGSERIVHGLGARDSILLCIRRRSTVSVTFSNENQRLSPVAAPADPMCRQVYMQQAHNGS